MQLGGAESPPIYEKAFGLNSRGIRYEFFVYVSRFNLSKKFKTIMKLY